MKIDKVEELAEFVEELGEYKGRHTELVSVYVPAGASLLATIKQLGAEKATASNIKSKATRKNVIDALEKLIRELKQVRQTPKNGLAIFCGNISRKQGQTDIQLFACEPHIPLNVKRYRCDQTFLLEPLLDIVESRDKYGLLVIDRNEATIGLLDGKHIGTLAKHTSGVPGKFKTGGSSAARLARLRDVAAKEFFKRVAESVRKEFEKSDREVKGLLIGGPGPTKDDFLKEVELGTLKKKVLAVEDIGDADEHGLGLLVEKSQKALQEEEITKEKILLKEFFTKLARSPEKVTYGMSNVKKALKAGAADKVLVYAKLDKPEREKLKNQAEETGAGFILVSADTEEGVQFKNLGEAGAFLRFPI